MAAVNAALDAAIAALQAQPYPWFLPGYSIRLTDASVYASLVSTYGFGTNVIIGLSPDAAGALVGVPVVADASLSSQLQIPAVYVAPSEQFVEGVPILTSQSGGTIMMSYTTARGRFDRVVWQWQCDVQLFPVADTVPPVTIPIFEQQVVTYTGDGTSNRLISTTFALNSGVVAVWIGGTGNDVNVFRANHAAMTGSRVIGSTTLQTTTGIMAFQAGGFTVTAGNLVGTTFANGAGVKYTAIVLRDSSSDNRYLRTGHYTGVGNFAQAMTVQAGSQNVSGVGFDPNWTGLVCSDASGTYVFTFVTSTTGTLDIGYLGATGGTNMNFVADNRGILVNGVAVFPITHLWVWGRGVQYRSTEFSGDSSVGMAKEAYPVTNAIQGFSSNVFTLGTENNVNNNGTLYDYMALSVDASMLLLFQSFKVTGTASPPVIASGLGFTPAAAFARQYTVALAGALWRGADHLTTHSSYCGNAGGPIDDVATGITAIGSGTVSCDTDIAPNGVDGYGWAFKGSGTIGILDPTPAPPFIPPFGPDPPFPPAPGPGPKHWPPSGPVPAPTPTLPPTSPPTVPRGFVPPGAWAPAGNLEGVGVPSDVGNATSEAWLPPGGCPPDE